MTVRGQLRDNIILLAMCAVLFALVCPIAPTPIAVLKGNTLLVVLVIVLVGLAAILLAPVENTRALIQPAVLKMVEPRPERLDLVCALLC